MVGSGSIECLPAVVEARERRLDDQRSAVGRIGATLPCAGKRLAGSCRLIQPFFWHDFALGEFPGLANAADTAISVASASAPKSTPFVRMILFLSSPRQGHPDDPLCAVGVSCQSGWGTVSQPLLRVQTLSRVGMHTPSRYRGQVTRFVVHCDAVLKLASEEIDVAADHELLARCCARRPCLCSTRPCTGVSSRPTSPATVWPHPGDADPAPRRRRAPTRCLEGRRPARVGRHLRRRVRALLHSYRQARFVTLDKGGALGS